MSNALAHERPEQSENIREKKRKVQKNSGTFDAKKQIVVIYGGCCNCVQKCRPVLQRGEILRAEMEDDANPYLIRSEPHPAAINPNLTNTLRSSRANTNRSAAIPSITMIDITAITCATSILFRAISS